MGLQQVTDPAVNSRLEKAIAFDPVVGLGVLMFEALAAACKMSDSPRQCEKILRWHLKPIKAMGEKAIRPGDAATAWNRHTDLTAQAIALGNLKVANEVLYRAKEIATRANSDAVSLYAAVQYRERGFEWMMHRVVEASYHLARSRRAKSTRTAVDYLVLTRQALADPLNPEYAASYPDRVLIFLRAAKLYQVEVQRATDSIMRRKSRVNAFAVPANTYWPYFAALPQGDSLWY